MNTTYQSSRTTSNNKSLLCLLTTHRRTSSTVGHRQHHGDVLREQTRSYTLPFTSISHHRIMGMVLPPPHLSSGYSHFNRGQLHCRLLKQTPYTTHKWTLDDHVFKIICHRWGHPSINLFASEHNTKCQRYCSQTGIDPNSLGDAFMIDWTGELLYLFPPIPLIQRSIVRIHQFQANAILIAPW